MSVNVSLKPGLASDENDGNGGMMRKLRTYLPACLPAYPANLYSSAGEGWVEGVGKDMGGGRRENGNGKAKRGNGRKGMEDEYLKQDFIGTGYRTKGKEGRLEMRWTA